tara:strand:- start:641 stop:1102 length:462 start_codon:yes stop_codon:yes gene_type:complete
MHPNYDINEKGEVLNLRKNKLMKIHTSYNGYKYVSLPGKTNYIHRLLGIKFIHNPLMLREINHIDGNKLNNDLNNLEWCSSSDNTKHAYKIGLQSQKGENNARTNLTNLDIMKIKQLSSEGTKQKELVNMFGVNQSNISRIINSKTWTPCTLK